MFPRYLEKRSISQLSVHSNSVPAELPLADYVFASGSLNYRSDDPDFVYKAIKKLYSACSAGIGFNLLRKTVDLSGLLAAYDPGVIAGYCRHLSHSVVLKTDYDPEDFTIWMYRDTSDR